MLYVRVPIAQVVRFCYPAPKGQRTCSICARPIYEHIVTPKPVTVICQLERDGLAQVVAVAHVILFRCVIRAQFAQLPRTPDSLHREKCAF